MSKKQVAVIFGGCSSEHEVSRVSAANIINSISKELYNTITIGITKSGEWYLFSGNPNDIPSGKWENNPNNKKAFISPDSSIKGLVVISDNKAEIINIDIVIPVLHGKNGEDGSIQGLLQLSKIPFVGCDMTSSAICMDKVITNTILEQAKIDQAKFVWFFSYEYQNNPTACIEKVENSLEYPVFVKPSSAGSSVGVSKANNRTELANSIEKAAKEDKKILIEENIIGQEVECAVLGNENPIASNTGEIATSAQFYDYESKYVNDTSTLYIPARIPNEISEKLRKIAIKAYKTLGCEGLTRVDFFVQKDGRILLNELNTFPGFTSISMYPKLMNNYGINTKELVNKLIALSLERAEKNV